MLDLARVDVDRRALPLTFAPGALIAGKYRVERVLGTGGMSVVVEATHLALEQRFALKLLHCDGAPSAELHERFLHEGRIAAQLPGEHVARAVDMGQTESGRPYLVMELLAGRDLGAELDARGRLPVAEAVHYVLMAAEGVAELHAVGLVHRDLKPANLFLTKRRDGTPLVKVLDFGIAKWAMGPSIAATVGMSSSGTPLYMAPEQLCGGTHVDTRCDQHALAVALYELVSGAPPFDGKTVKAIAISIMLHAPARLRRVHPDVPPGLDDALARALEKDPSMRFADLGAFAHAIAVFGDAEALASAGRTAKILSGSDIAAGESQDRVTYEPTIRSTARLGSFRRVGFGAGIGIAGIAATVAIGLVLDGPAVTEASGRSALAGLVANDDARPVGDGGPLPLAHGDPSGGIGAAPERAAIAADTAPQNSMSRRRRRSEPSDAPSTVAAPAPAARASRSDAAPARTSADTAREVFGARR